MAIVEKIQAANKTQSKMYDLACLDCVRRTRHKSLFSVELFQREDEPPFRWTEIYQIVQCQGCEHLSFREGFSEEDSFHLESWRAEDDYTVRIHPPRIAGRGGLSKSFLLPHIVLSVYEEIQSALSNQQPILAGIGIRALIECLCQEKKAAGSNLEQKIDNLVDLGVLTQDGAEILHRLRILGNESAHEIKRHDETTLYAAMDVVETILSNVYILPKVAESLADKKWEKH